MTKRPWKPSLVTRTGYLTPAFWFLKQGMVQEIRPTWDPKRKTYGTQYWAEGRWIAWLCQMKYLRCNERKHESGKRKGQYKQPTFVTTDEGAFAMLIAEGRANAIKEELANGAANTPKRKRTRAANTQVPPPRRRRQAQATVTKGVSRALTA